MTAVARQPIAPRTTASRLRLTDALVERLRLVDTGTPYRVADILQPGLCVVIGRHTKAFTAQADLRANGHRVRTLKRVLGRAADMSVRDARAAAREFLGRVARGEDPDRQTDPAVQLTLGRTWALYEQEHLRRLGRSEYTIAAYCFHVERCLFEWIDTPLIEIARDPRRAVDMHAKLTANSGPYQANAAMRSFRALYNFARRQVPGRLPAECPTAAVTFHRERRRNTAMGRDELAGWWAQLQTLKNPIRREFHLMTLLTGSRPGALKVARWRDVNARTRVLHVRRPKGGPKAAFDIPLSRAMLRSLWRVRKAGRALHPKLASEWIFPASSQQSHIVEHKQARSTLSHWTGDLRQTFRTIAQEIGISELDVHLLMNHSHPSVSAGYITRTKLLPSLRAAQERLSRVLHQHP